MIRDRENLPFSDANASFSASPRGPCTLKSTLDISVPLPFRFLSFVNQRGPDCSPHDCSPMRIVVSEE